jgi:hypothetical protein
VSFQLVSQGVRLFLCVILGVPETSSAVFVSFTSIRVYLIFPVLFFLLLQLPCDRGQSLLASTLLEIDELEKIECKIRDHLGLDSKLGKRVVTDIRGKHWVIRIECNKGCRVCRTLEIFGRQIFNAFTSMRGCLTGVGLGLKIRNRGPTYVAEVGATFLFLIGQYILDMRTILARMPGRVK